MRYYLDEDLSPLAAQTARAHGVDATCSHECGRNGASDDAQLAFAATEGRVMVTRNARDYCRFTEEFQRLGLPHAGLLLVPPSLPNDAPWRIGLALVQYDRAHPQGMAPYMVDYLRPPTAEK